MPISTDLTDFDYDALYVVMGKQMPRITREMFPGAFQELVAQGVLEILVTEDEIAVQMPVVPEMGVYRVERKPKLH